MKSYFSKKYIKNSLLYCSKGSAFPGMEIEIGYRPTHFGISQVNEDKTLAHSHTSRSIFEQPLMSVVFKNGIYYLESLGLTNIYRKFVPEKKFKIHPGHRICFGDNVFFLLQHVNFYFGDEKTLIIREKTSLSGVANVSIYAVVEPVGKENSCKDYVYNNFLRVLKEKCDEMKIDDSPCYYKTLGEIIYKTFDELEMGYLQKYPGKRKESGACIFVYLVLGNKIFTVNIGGLMGYLVQGRRSIQSNIEHSEVDICLSNVAKRKGAPQGLQKLRD